MGKIRPSFTTLLKMSGFALTISVGYFLQVFIKISQASRFPAWLWWCFAIFCHCWVWVCASLSYGRTMFYA